jgi:hypothetical protein
MKLFKIWQTENNGYETYDSAIVAAKSKTDAANIHPDTYPNPNHHTWVSPDKVFVEYLGTAKSKIKRGVICASFRAG